MTDLVAELAVPAFLAIAVGINPFLTLLALSLLAQWPDPSFLPGDLRDLSSRAVLLGTALLLAVETMLETSRSVRPFHQVAGAFVRPLIAMLLTLLIFVQPPLWMSLGLGALAAGLTYFVHGVRSGTWSRWDWAERSPAHPFLLRGLEWTVVMALTLTAVSSGHVSHLWALGVVVALAFLTPAGLDAFGFVRRATWAGIRSFVAPLGFSRQRRPPRWVRRVHPISSGGEVHGGGKGWPAAALPGGPFRRLHQGWLVGPGPSFPMLFRTAARVWKVDVQAVRWELRPLGPLVRRLTVTDPAGESHEFLLTLDGPEEHLLRPKPTPERSPTSGALGESSSPSDANA